MDLDYAGFAQALTEELAAFEERAHADQRELADDIVVRAKANVDVKDGVMRDALGVEEGADKDGKYIDVGVVLHPDLPPGHAAPQDYDLALELGHITPTGHHVPAHPFFRPAISTAEAAHTGPVR